MMAMTHSLRPYAERIQRMAKVTSKPLGIMGLCALTGFAAAARADDIDIYVNQLDAADTQDQQPNLMFLFDTGQGMDATIAVEIPEGAPTFTYDPTVDYGFSDNNRIYVYDTEFNYLDVNLTYQQSHCDAMERFFPRNTDYPVFGDQALQWQSRTRTEVIEELVLVCENQTVGTPSSGADSNRLNRNQWQDYGPFPVYEGSQVVVEAFSPGRNDEVRVYVRFDAPVTSRNYDRRIRVRDGSDRIDLTADATNSIVWIAVEGRDNNADYQISWDVSAGIQEVCREETVQTNIDITEANWSEALEQTSDNGWILECRDDRNRHGADYDPRADYVQNCGSNDCAQPSYTTNRRDEISRANVDERLFVTANMHDFIETYGPPDPDAGVIPQDDVGTACRIQPAGYQFTDNGVLYECTTKLEVLKNTLKQVVNSLENINIGLSRYNEWYGGHVVEAIRDIDGSASSGRWTAYRDEFIESVDNLAIGRLALASEAVWEMMLYFSGQAPLYGTNTYGANTDPLAIDRGIYASPMEGICQANSLVLVSEGKPSLDWDRDAAIRNLTGSTCRGSSYPQTADDTCLDELVGYMATHDLSTGANGLRGTQNVTTYVIGLDVYSPLFQTVASQGLGDYYTANTAHELSSALDSIVLDVIANSTSFVQPSISVNAFNRLQHRDEIYLSLFQPNNSPRWTGNVKKFRVSSDGTIVDANGSAVVNPVTGRFYDSVQDLWSDSRDGDDIEAGGFRSQLPDTRRVYTYIGDNPTNVRLNSGGTANLLATGNNLITRDLLGLAATASTNQRNNLILWGSGEDIYDEDGDGRTNDNNGFVGDIIHSKPVLVTYGGSENSPNDVLYVATNMGFMHAIDGATGRELWSFIPGELLDNIKQYQEGDTNLSKVYGLDGEFTLWAEESAADGDANIEPSEGDFVRLYQGMRRGGSNYFAWDLSTYNSADPARVSPVLSWKIRGGSGEFVDMGQSWSKMVHAKVAWNCSGDSCDERDVLFFSGGYDQRYDASNTPINGSLGNAIYMVDALTGQLLWSAGDNGDARGGRSHSLPLNDMDYSIPASPNLVDVDGDGLADTLFALDITGQVFRIDFAPDTTSALNFATGGRIVDLRASSGQFRRFYNQPDIVLSQPRGADAYFNLVFGSGFMASPTDSTQRDAIFVLFEDSVYAPPLDDRGDVNYGLTERDFSDLYNARATGAAAANKFSNAPYGYYISLGAIGEKIMRPGLIFQNQVTYTSYVPGGGPSLDPCAGDVGGSRLYRIDLSTGESLLTLEEAGADANGEVLPYLELPQEITPEAMILFQPDGLLLCVGNNCAPAEAPDQLVRRIYWREEDPND